MQASGKNCNLHLLIRLTSAVRSSPKHAEDLQSCHLTPARVLKLPLLGLRLWLFRMLCNWHVRLWWRIVWCVPPPGSEVPHQVRRDAGLHGRLSLWKTVGMRNGPCPRYGRSVSGWWPTKSMHWRWSPIANVIGQRREMTYSWHIPHSSRILNMSRAIDFFREFNLQVLLADVRVLLADLLHGFVPSILDALS